MTEAVKHQCAALLGRSKFSFHLLLSRATLPCPASGRHTIDETLFDPAACCSCCAVPCNVTCCIAGMGQLNISLLFAVFMTSAVLGDAVNYAIGNKLGESNTTTAADALHA